MSSPSRIIAQYLIDQGIVTSPSVQQSFPIFVSQLSDKPNEAVATMDIKSYSDGRIMKTGEVIHHPGVQFLFRASDYETCWNKAEEVRTSLESLRNATIIIGSSTYTVQSVSFTTDILSLGIQQDKNRRQMMSLNTNITLI